MRKFVIVAVMFWPALASQNNHRDFGRSQSRDRQMKTIKNIILILGVCSLCSKAVVHTCRHFNPPPPPIVGP